MTALDATLDRPFMEMAIEEAEASRRLGDYAIGAVITRGDHVVARVGNRIRTEIDASSHTEIVAIRMASRDIGSRYLVGHTLYSTAAPCAMCLGCCTWAKIDRIVYGVSQRDIFEFGLEHGNEEFKWRAHGIEPDELYPYLERAHPGMKIDQFMRTECLRLFHSR